jgi:hypothetical protein
MPLAYTAALAYQNRKTIRFGAYVKRVSIILTPDLRRPDIIARFERILQIANAAQSSIKFVLDDYSSDFFVNVKFDAKDSAFREGSTVVAFTHLYVSAEGVIREGWIVFPSTAYVEFVGWFEVVMLHEIGHILGLGHTPQGTPGLMSASLSGSNFDFTQQEKITLFVNYARIPGTVLKDGVEYEGVGVAAHAAVEVSEVRTLCPR